MSWKKIKIIDYIGHKVFSDKYGYCTSITAFVQIRNKDNSIENVASLYSYDESRNSYVKIERQNLNFIQIAKLALDKKIYRDKNNYNRRDYQTSLSKDNVVEASYNSVEVVFRYEYYSTLVENSGYYVQPHSEERFEISKLSDLDKHEVWYLEGSDVNSFTRVLLSDIKENEEFYLVGSGKVKVSKLYKYPNDKNLICDLKDENNKVTQFFISSSNLYYLPYSIIKNEFDLLNQSNNELSLAPYVASSNGIYNIVWQPIEEAALYRVTVYRLFNTSGRNRVYHMSDYEVDRNTHFISISGIVFKDIVFKVVAEDRSGKIIAESRCISSGFETKSLA